MPASSTSSSSAFSRIEVALGPSPGLALLAAAPWLLPAGLVMNLADIPAAVLAAIVAACVAGAVRSARQQLLLASHSPVQLRVGPDGLQLLLRDGPARPVQVGDESRLTHRLLWLRLHDGARSHTLLLSDLPGFRNTDPQSLRRFTGWLRLGPASAGNR